MTLQPGTRLGPYEILAALGAGGMGEVYRARDAKLNRDVAIKVLPSGVADDLERRVRFEREAQVLASLNHPHIGAIYGVEESHGVTALILELLEGPTLADRIAQGSIPLDETLAIARQVAEALEAAHEAGIVHRDLKPANIKLRPDGTVKVLDFGLAKALDPLASSGINAVNSPTLSIRATHAGIILGTAAYMAPEQAKGRAVDKRADIWAFGVVLCEMLTGAPLFAGESVSEILAAVIMKNPDLTALPSATPPWVKGLLARCLEKDPKLRLRDIGEARLALAAHASGAAPGPQVDMTPATPVVATTNRWLLALTSVLALMLGASGWLLWRSAATPVDSRVTRYDVRLPDKAAFTLISRPAVALSPDGSTLAFVAMTDGVARLYIRRRDESEPRVLAGTDEASNPVFSPDGRQIAFFAGGKLKKVTLDGLVMTLGEALDARGVAWAADGALVYAPDATGGLLQVPGMGGIARPVTTIDQKKSERTHRWPEALPGGHVVLFTVGTTASPDNYDAARIEAVVLATGERHVVLEGASSVRYATTGHLLFIRGSILYATRFDVNRLATQGAPVQLMEGVNGDTTTGASHVSVADDGTLAYVPGSAQAGLHRLMWVDQHGATQPIDLPIGIYFDVKISPDGTRAAVINSTSGSNDVWVYDFSRKTFTRLTFNGTNTTPVWSLDAKTIYYMSIEATGRSTTIMRKPADGSRDAEPVVVINSRAYLDGVAPDGTSAIVDFLNLGPGRTDVAKIALEPKAKPVTLVGGPFDEFGGAASPDGRWLAYSSSETSRPEIYVRDTSGSGARWQVSTSGGEEPRWSRDGRELYYRNDTRLMAVPIDTRTTFGQGTATVRLEGIYNLRSDTGISYDVDPKGGRFLMTRLASDSATPGAVRVVLNWFQDLRRLTATER